MLLKNDNLKPVRDRLLKDAAEFYQRLGGQLSGQADRGSRRALGQAYSEMAGLASKIGATDQAIAGHQQALAVRRGLAEAADADSVAKADVGGSLIDLGILFKETGRTDEGAEFVRGSSGAAGGPDPHNPAVTGFQVLLAWIPMHKKKPNNSPGFVRYFGHNQPYSAVF